MARKKPKEELPETEHRESVRHVPVEDARGLITVHPDSTIWKPRRTYSISTPIGGSIVRLRPPEGATDDDVEAARTFFTNAGAVKVIVLPRPRAELLPEKAASQVKAVGAREAVIGLVEESNSKDRDALRELCERVMGEVGL